MEASPIVLNPNTIISDCLETAFNLKTYVQIIDAVASDGFTATSGFRKMYNGFYRVRQKRQGWYDRYFQLLEEQKKNIRSFEELLAELYMFGHTIETSFISKLMATVDPKAPIWDRYVLQNLGYAAQWDKVRALKIELRIAEAAEIYREIQNWYDTFSVTADGKACIKVFDEALPEYKEKLSSVKKIDYMFME